MFGRTDCKTPTTKLSATHLQFRWNSDFCPDPNKEDCGSALSCPTTYSDVVSNFFPTLHHSHSKWHASHNRKFLKRYKFRENYKTISLHIHKEVNSCSQKLKLNQVDSRVTAGLLMEKLPLEESDFYHFLSSKSTHWKIKASLQQQVPKGADPLLLVLSPTKQDYVLALPWAAAVYATSRKNTPQFTCGIVIIMFL